jgi:hypothetical protein
MGCKLKINKWILTISVVKGHQFFDIYEYSELHLFYVYDSNVYSYAFLVEIAASYCWELVVYFQFILAIKLCHAYCEY